MSLSPKPFRFAFAASLAVVLLGSSSFESRAFGDEGASLTPALKAVQGVWTTRDDDEVQAKWTIKDQTFKAVVNGVEYVGKVTVDDAAKPHPTFTIDVTEGPGEVVGKAAKGVYKLEDDKLTVNLAAPGKDRPVDLNPYGEDIYLFELTKDKSSK